MSPESLFGATVITRTTDCVCTNLPLSLTVATNLKPPLVWGVPEMAPVEAERLSPGGKLPDVMDHVYAGTPPVACRFAV